MSCLDRFERHCNRKGPSDCWEWSGPRDHNGYGQLHCQAARKSAHRFSLMLETGEPIPEGMVVLHTCDNPPCVNPAHLKLGTQADNMRDKALKGRSSRVGVHGVKHPAAKFTAEDIAAIRSSDAPHAELARRYGVTATGIAYVRKHGWKSIGVESVAPRQGKKGRAGSANKRAVLTEANVVEIRSSDGVSTKTLAEKFGVTQDCIRLILRRASWKHI